MFVCAALLAGRAAADETEARRPVPLYTNEDLDRVHRFRDQTGVASVPDSPTDGADAGATGARRRGKDSPAPRAGARGEAYWRAEVRRVRERVRALQERADELRRRIAEAGAEPWSSRRRRAAPDAGPLKARLAAIEERQRALENDLQDQARREGAMPGWLR